MPESIEIDDDVFVLLKRNAEPFVDTPNTVLRRMLGIDSNGSIARPAPASKPAADTARKHSVPTSPKARSRGGTRAARGSLLPESEYELPILQYLAAHDGRAPSREVVEAVGETLADQLTEADKQPLNSGEIRWKSRAAFVRLRLIEGGDLDGEAPRGTWQITDQGRQRLASV